MNCSFGCLAFMLSLHQELFQSESGLESNDLLNVNNCITFCLISRFSRVKRPAVLTPLIPMSFVLLYVGDLGYGSKLHRIHAEAEMIMEHEKELLDLPCGLPSIASIDAARVELDEER